MSLPPHQLAPRRDDLERAKGKYKKLNKAALQCVRPGGLLDAPGGAAGVKVFQGDDLRKQGRIPRADVATVCLEALGNPAARSKTFELIGDTPGTRTDFAAMFAGLVADAR